MEEEIEQREMHFNHTTPHISPLSPKPGFPGYYALISLALLTLIGCIVAAGCVDSELCDSHEIISYRGVKYNVSHTCCCKDKCNGPPKSDISLKKLLGMITDRTDYTNITNVLREEMLNMLQLLHVAVLWFYLLIPSLLCDNLLCYYSPILEREKTFELIVTECPPNELCFKADGHYGNHSALSARGCMAKKDCSQVKTKASAWSNDEGLQQCVVNTQSEDTEVCTKVMEEFLLMVSIIIVVFLLLAFWLAAVEWSSPPPPGGSVELGGNSPIGWSVQQ
ncbi:protein Bouncer-like protein [Lates japonicus]|uniref:Protein Bouncer-like protein n=1 Tax=Lates japonicus TaxID=270547 RepID=A0AAD3NDE1_LATJO|nr:protein Bouncer-like protein [Lates japonicus]